MASIYSTLFFKFDQVRYNRFMEVIKIDLKNPDQKIINQAVGILKKGGTVVYPTDTAYGLGALAFDQKAIKKIFQIKKRARSKPISVIVSEIAMAVKLVYISSQGRILMEKFLPGPVTFIFPKKECVSDILTAGRKTLGIRIPKNKIALQLARKLRLPYTTTSANLSGENALYSACEIINQFKNIKLKPDLILDAGKLKRESLSTVVDLSISPPKILREGAIPKEKILKYL